MNNLQTTIKDKFDKDYNIKQELSMLNANGFDLDIDIEFIDDIFEVKLSIPRFTKSYLNSNSILNTPSLSLSNFEMDINDTFELEKPNKQEFRQSAIDGGFTPEIDNFEDIVSDIYHCAINDIEKTATTISNIYETNINLGLGFLKESINTFNYNTTNFIDNYKTNILNNKTIIQVTIDRLKKSSSKDKALNFFKNKYFNLIQSKKLSLSKLQKNIDTIRNSPWYSYSSVIAKIKLFIHNYELQKEQYNLMLKLQDKIYIELEETINEAFENLILDKQQLLQNKDLDVNEKIELNELYKYIIPIYDKLLKKYKIKV